MSEVKRNIFSSSQKAKVALEAIQGQKTVNQIAQEFSVHPTQVGLWKKTIQENAQTLFDNKRGPKSVKDSDNTDRLYSEIGRLKMELDWLKKKSGLTPS